MKRPGLFWQKQHRRSDQGWFGIAERAQKAGVEEGYFSTVVFFLFHGKSKWPMQPAKAV